VSELAVPRPGPGVWLMAARPRTLSAAVSPVLVGTAIAHRMGAMRPLPALLALFAALLIQVGTNFANDYSDFKHGADANRVGPTRVTQSGLVAPRTVKLAAWLAFGLSGIVGIALAALSGWPILAIGAASVAAGWLYTGGPWPLGYHGLGDLFVLVFFGLVATCGTVYAQSLAVPTEAWLAGAAVGSVFSQMGNETPRYGRGGAALGKRFGAAVADCSTQSFFSRSINRNHLPPPFIQYNTTIIPRSRDDNSTSSRSACEMNLL